MKLQIEAEMKFYCYVDSKSCNCKTKKCLKEEEKPNTKNEKRRERREERERERA